MSEAEDISKLTTELILNKLHPFIIDAPEGRTLLVMPTAGLGGVHGCWSMQDITSPNKTEPIRPKYVTQTVNLQTVDSMIEYVKSFKNVDSMVFADIEKDTILGIIDYHKIPPANRSVEESDKHDAEAQFGKHQARMVIPKSLEWQTWLGRDGKLMSHKDFATFLEENSIDVLPLARPAGLATSEDEADAPTTLLELTRSLQVVQNVNFNSSVRHGSYDKVDFQKEADATARGTIQLPLSFRISIPVYFNEQPVEITAFIRKQIDDGVLRIGYSLNRVENMRQAEFHRIVGTIAGSVALSTVYGKPSA